MKYSISKFRDFLNFLGTFSDFEHIYENATPIFKVKISKNVLRFSKSEIYKNATLHYLNQYYDFSKLKS